ncbi:hypothetical protein Poli38472_010413 [Pythium oligandrum]|uniref:Uncharacterized protein n=1 Tax=Pythium oligandrum TaxID=41045 RepID=A0A8K1FAX8_PYTOL|nr:hypothetical protein Poli38472_010413 [Pythium oligandrum]|eukprot:TMW55531.1 hypothetical protein Poli38472_010413 [Pythium oligandrum]
MERVSADARLPLHPRKAQELFFELIEAGQYQQTSTGPTQKSIPDRLGRFQAFYATGIRDLKRGRWVRRSPTQEVEASSEADGLVYFRLCQEGKSIEILQRTDPSTWESNEEESDRQNHLALVSRITLQSISRLWLLAGSTFRLEINSTVEHSESETTKAEGKPNQDEVIASNSNVFEVDTDTVLRQTILVLLSGRYALDLKSSAQRAKTEGVLWQALRLRLFELSEMLPFHQALQLVEDAFQVISVRESECELPDMKTRFLLHSDTSIDQV